MRKSVAGLCLALPALLLAACNSGSYSSSPGPGDLPQGISGDDLGLWSGTEDSTVVPSNTGLSVPVVGAIQKDAAALFFDANGNVISVAPPIQGTGSISGTLFLSVAYSNVPVLPYFMTGTFSSTRISMSGGSVDTDLGITASPYVPYAGTPSFSAGTWQGVVLGGSATLALSVDAAGGITGTDAGGCAASGQLTQVGANHNLYSVVYTGSNRPGQMPATCNTPLTGLGFLSSTDYSGRFGSGVFFYLILSNADTAYVIESKMP